MVQRATATTATTSKTKSHSSNMMSKAIAEVDNWTTLASSNRNDVNDDVVGGEVSTCTSSSPSETSLNYSSTLPRYFNRVVNGRNEAISNGSSIGSDGSVAKTSSHSQRQLLNLLLFLGSILLTCRFLSLSTSSSKSSITRNYYNSDIKGTWRKQMGKGDRHSLVNQHPQRHEKERWNQQKSSMHTRTHFSKRLHRHKQQSGDETRRKSSAGSRMGWEILEAIDKLFGAGETDAGSSGSGRDGAQKSIQNDIVKESQSRIGDGTRFSNNNSNNNDDNQDDDDDGTINGVNFNNDDQFSNSIGKKNNEDDDGLQIINKKASSASRHQHQQHHNVENDNGSNAIPVIHANNDVLPPTAEETFFARSLPASDALECRASVIAFVINATDVRDECDGLRKAFDKTCSVNNNAVSNSAAATNTVSSGGASRERRRLKEWGRPLLWNLIEWQAWRSKSLFGKQRRHTTASSKHKPEIIFTKRTLNQQDQQQQRSSNNIQIAGEGGETKLKPNVEELNSDMPNKVVGTPVSESPVVPPPLSTKKDEITPKISLMIPTADEHIADQMLNDALLLQQSKSLETKQEMVQPQLDTRQEQQQKEENLLPYSNETLFNSTANVLNPQAAEAARDASESAEAIRTATEAVKNMMIDPKSVEARTCCASILSVFHEHCDPTTTGIEGYSDRRLLVIVFVITVCGMVKSIIRYFNIRWLPEAGGCILVGVLGYFILQNMTYVQYAFDGDLFLRILVPPIVFEAAVKINKRSFQRHVIPITIFAIIGTLMSTALTATILHKGSEMMAWCATIPVKESLIFGSLISSIDPIAVLSVLNNMGMTDSDTIYVLIFGESLLNDGIAIVLFQTLVHFLDESLVIDGEAVIDAIMHFVVVALGSLFVGVLSGACATVYFAVMHGCQTPMVELIMFFCWAFIPYFICDMVEWSGIVAIVANGFVMDLYIIGQKKHVHSNSSISSVVEDEIGFLVNGSGSGSNISSVGNRARSNRRLCRHFFSYDGHLSPQADDHVHFIIEIFATLMETAIFAYLGLFLFSSRYHWNLYLTIISILATVMGRVIMIPTLSHISNFVNRMSFSRTRQTTCLLRTSNENSYDSVHVDRKMQVVLIFAGLRGAMSFALVEHIPLFDTITGQGSRLKPELKAMTSASIIFTVFILGGATSYLMERIGYNYGSDSRERDEIEVIPLVSRHIKQLTPNSKRSEVLKSKETSSVGDRSVRSGSSSVVRQRGASGPR